MSANALDTLLSRLNSHLGPRLRTDDAACQAAAGDHSHIPACTPRAVVMAHSTEDVVVVAREAHELGVGLVPRGAGTGKAGGCIPGPHEVVVDVSEMRQICALKPQDLYAEVQPGVITANLDEAAAEHGLMYPPDPGSWETCTIGGNIATNAGGPRAVKYGVTARYVWGLEVVLAGGDVLTMGRHSIKGVAGLNLTSLFVGSEGILGFITRATMHLVPSPRGVQTAWLCFDNVQSANHAAERIFAAGMLPRMLELLDAPALAAVTPYAQWPIPQSSAALLVETDAATDAVAHSELIHLCEAAAPATSMLASSEEQREMMRRSRRQVSEALKKIYPFKVSDDIAVPRSHMPALLEQAHQFANDAGLAASAYGHLGDGNLHINLLCKTAEERAKTPQVRLRLYQFAVGLGGTVSGEHGIGLSKREALTIEQPSTLRAVQQRLKATLDPRGIINPGKIFC